MYMERKKKKKNGNYLKAEAEGVGSGLGKEIKINLNKTPFINITWKIEKNLFTFIMLFFGYFY